MSIQPMGRDYVAAEISYAPPDEKTMLKQILAKTKTMSAPGERTANDMTFVKNVILPVFMDLYKKNWPKGYYTYKLLMRSNFIIKIINYKADEFSAKNYAPDMPDDSRLESIYEFRTGDISTIKLNKFDKFTSWRIKESLQHEIMHSVNNFLVKDASNSIELLSDHPDIDGSLTALQQIYMGRLEKAVTEIRALASKNLSVKRFYEEYEKIIDKRKCWACEKYDPKNGETLEQFLEHCGTLPYNTNEFLSYGLQSYFGTDKDRLRLQNQEPDLYKLIVTRVLPKIKNSAAARKA